MRKLGYSSRKNYRTIFKIIYLSVKQKELVSIIDNTSQLFYIKVPKSLTKYELANISKRKYIQVVQIILKPKKNENYYKIVRLQIKNNVKYNQIIKWKYI